MAKEGDVKYGSLFKQSGFFKPSNNRSWGKRFFLFNTRTMLLQYWPAEEARIFKIEQAVRGPPRSSISLLSSNLRVESGPIERSMFGQKFPIKISNGPAFAGRTLVLAANSPVARETWINAIQSSIENLSERQKVNVIQTKIITDPSQPGYNSVENQYMMVKEKEAQVKELDSKISRTLVQCELMRTKDIKLYNLQERLLIAHREIEDKLYSMTQEENNPQRRFKFIKLNNAQMMFDELPMGIYRHTAPQWVNDRMGKKDNKLNIPESDMRSKHVFKQEPTLAENLYRISNRFLLEKNKEHKLWKLEDKEYHPYVTYNTVADGIDKQYDDSPKAFLNDATGAHEIRTFSDSQDYDTKSLKEMNVFDMLKSETRKPYFHLLQRLDKTDCNDPDDEPFFPDDEQIAREILDHEDQIDLMDDISRHQDAAVPWHQAEDDYYMGKEGTAHFNDEWEERYKVDNSGRRF